MNKIKVVVDKRTELMAILLITSDKYREKFPHLTNNNVNEEYLNKIQIFSTKIKNHPIIKTYLLVTTHLLI